MTILETYNKNTNIQKGIFTIMNEQREINIGWMNNALAVSMDYSYYYGRSPTKNTSVLFNNLYNRFINNGDNESNAINSAIREIAFIIYRQRSKDWQYLYDSLFSEYNPIENYSMVENETPEFTTTVDSAISSKVETDIKNKGFGFNSIIGSDTSEAKQTVSGNMDDNKSNTVSKQTGKRELTRKGNIGVTTTQQMITQEIELRKSNFFDIIYKDVDKILTSPLY